MHVVQRALSVVAVTAVAVPALGSGAAAAGPAPERAAPPPASSAPVSPQKGLLDPLSLLLAPVLTGLGQVGQLLTVSQPEWSLPGVTTDIEWLCNGQPIPGTQGAWSFLPGELQAGCLVVARVTGTLLGVLPVSVLTNALQITAAPKTPVATKAPAVSGDPRVGKQLTVSPPTWEGDGVTTTYQWLRAGAAIAGATGTTYTLAPEDLAKAITVRATGTRQGAPEAGVTTSNTVTPAPGEAPTATTPVGLTGTPRVGEQLTATPPTWSGTGPIVTTYQWLRDGAPVDGATSATYAVVPSDADHALSVRAVGTRVGYQPGSSTSAPVTVSPGEPLTATVAPSIAGTPAVGSRLRVLVGTWAPDAPGLEHGFQWLRDGSPIAGATTDAYVVQAVDAGHELAVRVTAAATGYSPGSATTASVAVPRVGSRTTLAAPRPKVTQGKRAMVRVTVAATGVTPSGTVTVREGGRVLATVTLRPGDTGSRTVRLPRLAVGTHQLVADYAGDDAVAGSTSRTVTVTVVKKRRR